MKPSDCRTAADVDGLAKTMFGPLLPFTGVSHVTAAWANPTKPMGAVGCELITMAIRKETPKSEHDFFMLNLARARADAIIVTGKILRDELELEYTLQGAGELPRALADWRAGYAGRSEPPRLIVLTSGRGLDPEHPALSGAWATPVIYTSADAELPSFADDVQIVRAEEPSLRAAVRWAREQGAEIVSLETGPSTTQPLYEPPVTIDELLLGLFRGRTLPAVVRLAKLFDEFEPPLPALGGPFAADEPSGPWTFQRHARNAR